MEIYDFLNILKVSYFLISYIIRKSLNEHINIYD